MVEVRSRWLPSSSLPMLLRSIAVAFLVLLAAAPLAEAQESRYRARIYRGLAITV